MFKRLTLRQKLIIVLAVPLIVLAILAGIRIANAIDARNLAIDQQAEIDRTVTLFQLANSVRSERDAVLIGTSTVADLDSRRENVDEILSRLNVPEAGYSPEVRQGLAELANGITTERQIVGSLDAMPSAVNTGQSATTFDQLAAAAVDLVDFDEDLVINPETGRQLATLQLAVELNESINREALTYFTTSNLPGSEQTPRVLRDAADLGTRTVQVEETLFQLATDDAVERFNELIATPAHDQFIEVQAAVANAAGQNEPLDPLGDEVLSAFGFRFDLETYQGELLANVLNGAADARTSASNDLWRTVAAAAVIGLLVTALTIALYLSIRRPLRRLTNSALRIAEEELPEVVALMRSSETAGDKAFEVTPLVSESNDEIGQLVDSFNKLHVTAVDLAAQQAQSRRTASDMFANLGRRNQRLLTQALDDMDLLERNEQDPGHLARLYSVDQKITRMRRNAESLIVLAGQHTPRQWSEPAAVGDVMRATMSEVENFDRVEVRPGDQMFIKGAVVADLTHLLAELLENALRFSPPTSTVEIGAYGAGPHAAIVIIDRGVGLTLKRRNTMNRLIAEAASDEETPSKRLGLYVVGRLAARHGLTVKLKEDPITQGTIARVALGPALASENAGEYANAAESDLGQADTAAFEIPASDQADVQETGAIPSPTRSVTATPSVASQPEPATAVQVAAVPVTAASQPEPAAAVQVAAVPVTAASQPEPATAVQLAAVPVTAASQPEPAAAAPAPVPMANRIPGTNFGIEPTSTGPGPAQTSLDAVAGPVSESIEQLQPGPIGADDRKRMAMARRVAARHNLDRRPLSSEPPASRPRATTPTRGSRAGAQPARVPAQRVPGQNLPAALRKADTTQHRVATETTSTDGNYWDAFSSFQNATTNSKG